MRVFHKPRFPVLYLAVGLAVFGVSYTLLELSQGGGASAQPAQSAQPEQTDGDRLIAAISFDDNQAVKDLLKAGADPNSLSTDGILPLQIAVLLGKDSPTGYGLVKLLIDHGANPNQLDTKGLTPMDEAAKHGTEAIMTVFLDAGGDPNLPTNGLTPYKRALMRGNAGPLAAIEKALPDHTPEDKAEWKTLQRAGKIHKGMMEALSLTGEARNARIRKMLNQLVSEGHLTEQQAAPLYQQAMEQINQLVQERGSRTISDRVK